MRCSAKYLPIKKHLEQQMLPSQHHTAGLTLFFVFRMQWRLHLLYILTLSEHTTVHLSLLTSFIHVVMCVHWVELQLSEQRQGDQKVFGMKTATFREENEHLFFLSMLQNVQYLEMILFTDIFNTVL